MLKYFKHILAMRWFMNISFILNKQLYQVYFSNTIIVVKVLHYPIKLLCKKNWFSKASFRKWSKTIFSKRTFNECLDPIELLLYFSRVIITKEKLHSIVTKVNVKRTLQAAKKENNFSLHKTYLFSVISITSNYIFLPFLDSRNISTKGPYL